jgi:hypothetical protein
MEEGAVAALSLKEMKPNGSYFRVDFGPEAEAGRSLFIYIYLFQFY